MKKKLSRNIIIKYFVPPISLALLLISAYAIKIFVFKPKTTKKTSATNKNSKILNIDFLKQKLIEAKKFRKSGARNQEIEIYKNLLGYQSYFACVHLNLGKALYLDKKYKSAEKYFRKAVELKPNYSSGHVFLGKMLQLQNKYEESKKYLETACKISPKYFDANLHLSKAYYQLNQFDKALHYAHIALKLKPKNIYAQLNLAYTYNKGGELNKAIRIYKKILGKNTNLANAHYNLGYTYKIQGRLDKAIESLDRAIEIRPDYLEAHIARAQAKIASERILDGWDEYEWRWGLFGIKPMQYKRLMWNGSYIKDKTILLRTEQGLGDTMQFIRYAKIIKDMGATVICKVQKPLVKLLSSCPYIDEVFCEIDNSIKYDTHAQIMSLPRILNTTNNTIPNEMNYLYANPKLEEEWKEKLSQDKNFKVGLCWHVDPIHEKDKSPWSIRSITLKQFKPFAKLNGVSFYSLQKFKDYKPLMNLPKGLLLKTFGEDFDEKNGAFMDSAAIIKNLDLVITVDTCIAHLAGALNKPVWMFLPYSPDCRWYLKRTDTPWYPTMKLYRQSKPNDWKNAIKKVASDLSKEIKRAT